MESLFPGLNAAPDLHPVVVHFPIAFWVAAMGAWIVGAVRGGHGSAWRFGLWLHTLALVAAALAVALGFAASSRMGHDTPGHDIVHVHRNFMVATTALAAVITTVGWWRRQPSTGWRIGLSVASVALVAVMSLGADRGGLMVFGHGVGVAEQPPSGHGGGHGHGQSSDPSEEGASGTDSKPSDSKPSDSKPSDAKPESEQDGESGADGGDDHSGHSH